MSESNKLLPTNKNSTAGKLRKKIKMLWDNLWGRSVARSIIMIMLLSILTYGLGVVVSSQWEPAGDLLKAVGSNLFGVSVIVMVFETWNRWEWKQLLQKTIGDSQKVLSKRVSADVVDFLVSDKEFVKNLGSKKREKLLKSLIATSLGRDSGGFAEEMAKRLASKRRMSNFEVSYVLKEETDGTRYCSVRMSFIISSLPKEVSYLFALTSPGVENNIPSTVKFTHAVRAGADIAETLEFFHMKKLSVNGTVLKAEKESKESMYRFYSYEIPPMPEGKIKYEAEMVWPYPVPGFHVHFGPHEICTGLDISCDYSADPGMLVNAVIEPSILKKSRKPDTNPRIIKVETNEMIMPSSSAVSFYFIENRKELDASV